MLDKLALGSDAMAGDSPGVSQMIGSPAIYRVHGSEVGQGKGRNKDKESGPVSINLSKNNEIFSCSSFINEFNVFSGLGTAVAQCFEQY